MELYVQHGLIGGPSALPEENLERNSTNPVETYNDAFPSLPGGSIGGLNFTARPLNHSMTKTEMMNISVEERKFDEHQSDRLYQNVKDIQDKSGAKIDVSSAKDHSLTLAITGRQDCIGKARQLISTYLTKEASLRVRVAKEFHRFILGAKGKTLNSIENETGTRIVLPRAENANDDPITITGSKEGLHMAARRIQAIVDEQSKIDRKIVKIPQQFHDLMPVQQLMALYGGTDPQSPKVRIHMPPKTGKADRPDEIVVTGEREPVGKVAADLEQLYKTKERSCKTLNLTIAKQKHKYIIGPKGASIQEIFAATGVAIKVPPPESDSDQVTLFGESDKIGNAVSLVLQKADSSNRVEVPAPGWLQRYLRPTIDKLRNEYPKVHIDFVTAADHIALEGPTQDVDKIEKVFREAIDDLLKRLKFAEIKVNPKYFRHLIGAGGKHITQLHKDTGVNIIFPDEKKTDARSDIIRIEGDIPQVEVARRKLMDIVTRIENEKSREISIEKRYHRFLVAKKTKLLERFPDVYISFPRQEEKSDIVEIRGNKNKVDETYKCLQKMYEEVKIENYEVSVSVLKQFHKRIIGKHGANVAKIREQTHVEIDLPPPNSDSQKIVVRGRRENVEKAIELIEQMQRTFENITEIHVELPHKFHEALIGPRGAGVKAIEQMNENVIIRFPGEKDKGSDNIKIVGPKEEVEAARKMLIERANDVKDTTYSEELRIKPEYHRYLIGRKGAKVREIYEETKARVVFPDSDAIGEDAEIVVIVGRESDVNKARKMIDAKVKQLEETKEETVHVEPKYHKHFVERRGMVVNSIASECGGVTISFPRQGVSSSDVSVKGPKDCVSEAVKRISEEVEKLKRVVTIEVEISQKHRRSMLGGGNKTFEIMKEFDVNIVFPPPLSKSKIGENGEKDSSSRDTSSPEDSEHTENSTAEHSPTGTDENEPMMTVTITGLDEACACAREALLALIPVTEQMEIPQEHHRGLIGQKGVAIRELSNKYNVQVKFPGSNEASDIVVVSGTSVAVECGVEAIRERVRQLEAEKEDRILKSFKTSVFVNPLLQQKLMSRGWQATKHIQKKYDVHLSFPPKEGQAEDEIIIQGYESNCNDAKSEIERFVGPIESQFVLNMPIDRRYIPRLMGYRGSNLQEIKDKFKVEIIVPQGTKDEEEAVNIQIVGPEDDIYLCRNHLEVLQEDALMDLPPPKRDDSQENARGASNRQRPHFQLPNSSPDSKKKGGRGYVLKDAPWSHGGGGATNDMKNTPDLGSSHDFPAFLPGQGPTNGHDSNGVMGSSGWGPRG